MRRIPVALQLWSVRHDLKSDFTSTVGRVARMGYTGVELAGYGTLDVAQARAALNDAGLAVAGCHVSYLALESDVERVIAEAQILGTRHVICSSWPKGLAVTRANCESIGAGLRTAGSRLRAAGLQLSFHNHAHELEVVGGRTGLEWIVPPDGGDELTVELDVYWLQFAGQSPAAALTRYGGLCRLVHLKDRYSLGSGPVDFPEVFAAIDVIPPLDWLIVEQEEFLKAPLESVQDCLEQMKRWNRA